MEILIFVIFLIAMLTPICISKCLEAKQEMKIYEIIREPSIEYWGLCDGCHSEVHWTDKDNLDYKTCRCGERYRSVVRKDNVADSVDVLDTSNDVWIRWD